MKRLLLIATFVFLSLAGCSSIQEAYKGNPTPKDFLSNDKADIFMCEGIVYSNTPVLIAVVDGEEIPYLAMLEG